VRLIIAENVEGTPAMGLTEPTLDGERRLKPFLIKSNPKVSSEDG